MSLREQIRHWRLWPMLWKEFVQMRRDRLTLGIMVMIPAIQLVIFGFAIRTDVRHLPTVVLDESGTTESRRLVDVMRNTGNFDVVAYVQSRAEVKRMIDRGSARAAVVIPPDFQRGLKRGRGATAQVIVDAADPMASQSAMSGAMLAGQASAAELTGRRAAAIPLLDVRVRPWYNPALRSEVYIVPGLVGVLLSMTMILITSLAITRERERGTLEQLIVTPIGKTSMMLGKILPFVLVGYVQMTVILLLGWVLFGVPVRGNLPGLYAISLLFVLANLGLGLFVSTVARTQAQAMQLSFMLLMPNILLSGFMFPREAMPRAMQWISTALPLTHYLRVLRGILLKGVGVGDLWQEAAILAVMAIVILMLSVARFSKTIE
ncbi:ABC transporter permease [Longimicrobium sp.]|uniref:ABC transporter permease n=1 Tax=Longimicrobium sp. TaxID=2029185 RepID=UPI002BBAA336|nr:ABC transporter permease [Longimicrobium sp.]HSU15921.1 ABC transporter permease [Longimicrobium sp.]